MVPSGLTRRSVILSVVENSFFPDRMHIYLCSREQNVHGASFQYMLHITKPVGLSILSTQDVVSAWVLGRTGKRLMLLPQFPASWWQQSCMLLRESMTYEWPWVLLSRDNWVKSGERPRRCIPDYKACTFVNRLMNETCLLFNLSVFLVLAATWCDYSPITKLCWMLFEKFSITLFCNRKIRQQGPCSKLHNTTI